MDKEREIISAPNGDLNFRIGSRTLYSRYNPSGSSIRLVSQAEILPRTIYFIPSPLFGYGLSELLDSLPEDSIVLAVETDQQLMKESSPYLEKLRSPRCLVYRLDSPVSLYRVFYDLQPARFRNCRIVPLNGGYSFNKKLYDSLFSSLQSFQQYYWRNRLTTTKLGRLWMQNLLINMAETDLRDLGDFKTTKPVILAGAGESLEESLPFMKTHRDKFFILSVDTAVQALARGGILPDGVVNLEAQFHNLKDFYPLKGHSILQFSDITAYPQTLRDFQGDHYYFSSRFGTNGLVEEFEKEELLPAEIPALGSVGVTALYVAGEITEAPILLTGLDFSYREGKSHARETPFHDWMKLLDGRLGGDAWLNFTLSRPSIPALSKDGRSGLRTNPVLQQYGCQLRDLCHCMDGRVYDIAEGGADFGIPRLTPSEALELCISPGNEEKSCLENKNSDSSSERNRTVLRILKKEKDKLEALIKMWERVNAENAEPEALIPLLIQSDFSYYHFPDTISLPNTRPEFLFRALQSVRRYYRLLSRLTS